MNNIKFISTKKVKPRSIGEAIQRITYRILAPGIPFYSGMYRGYCHASGIQLPSDVEFMLTNGPSIVNSSAGALFGGIMGISYGATFGLSSCSRDSALENIVKTTSGATVGIVGGVTVGAVFGAAISYASNYVGYMIGQYLTHLSK